VATPETEGFWYEAAKKNTTRQIEKLVAFSPKGGLPPAQIQLPARAPPSSSPCHTAHNGLPVYPAC